ncbi:MAG: hypothetical protein M1832_005583 [Thelocarpon impressellum]|nr:MAG: hypothetical protein M1832_005583 [Thelocarpon impressellum]
MSAMNGVLANPAPPDTITASSSVPAKRKRAAGDKPAPSKAGATASGSAEGGAANARRLAYFTDLLEIVKRYDSNPSVLNRPLSRAAPSSPEPSGKRSKPSEPVGPRTIASSIASGTYTNLGSLVADVSEACSAIIAELQPRDPAKDNRIPSALSPQAAGDAAKVQNVLAFKEVFTRAVVGDPRVRSKDIVAELVNGEAEFVGSGGDKTVLTLYGNAPQPKQLFSSLVEPVRVPPAGAGSDAAVPVMTPLREVGLPNGISTTKIVSVPPEEAERKPAPTLGALFPPPAALAQLVPPKPSRHTTTRGPTVGWYQPSEADLSPRGNRRGTYTTQPLTTGRWLNYNALPQNPELGSPDARRKRAPSFGETKPAAVSQEVLSAHSKAKEDALFRRTYSGFAPSKDDTAAIVPQEIKSRLWWDRVGEKRFARLLTSYESIDESADAQLETDPLKGEEDIIKEEAIESWVPEDAPKDLGAEEDEADGEKEVEKLLADISDLLETVNSYQRIRHLSSGPPRPTSAPTDALSAMTGTPLVPSSSETDVYNLLRSQLAVLVASLPPYAVAKLDGDQLAELNITPRVAVEAPNYKGVLEEDEPLKARPAPVPQAGRAPATPGYSTPQPPRPGYTPQMANSRPPQPPPNQYYQQPQQSPGRPVNARAAGATPHYRTPRSVAPGPPYAQNPYGQQPPRSVQGPPYGQTNPAQYFQQPGYAYNAQQYQTPPQGGPPAPAAGQYQRPSQPAYQQHAQQRGKSSSEYLSPQKSASLYTGPQQTPQQTRPYLQQTANTSAAASLKPSAQSGDVGASGFHTYMTAEQQASMMERQRAQLAATGVLPPAPVASPAGAALAPQPPAQQGQAARVGQVNGE